MAIRARWTVLAGLCLCVGCPDEAPAPPQTDVDGDGWPDVTDDCVDGDGDGYGRQGYDTSGCAEADHDCDDADARTYPGAHEICDAVDNDCDGQADDDCITCDLEVPGTQATIQEAIDDAADGQTVCVDAGTYHENVVLSSHDVRIVGLGGAALTIIDGVGAGPVVTMDSGQDPATVLERFTLTNGWATEGGGLMLDGASPTLRDLVVCDNVADDGGGVFMNASSPTLTRVEVTGNEAVRGGGIFVANASTPELAYTTISDNLASGFESAGGGLYSESSSPTFSAVVVSDNWTTDSGAHGGGLCILEAPAVLTNVAVVGNWTEGDGANGGGIYIDDNGTEMTHVAVVGNQALGSSTKGGGIYTRWSWVDMTHAMILGNLSGASGGGLHIHGGALSVTNAAIVDNSAGESGGGLLLTGSEPNPGEATLLNVVLASNTASVDGGAASGEHVSLFAASHCDTWANVPDDYEGLDEPSYLDGNVSIDPGLTETAAADPWDWDLHLTATSPLIDVGDPNLLDPDGSPSDIGPYGGPDAGLWDLDLDGWYEWWQPGEYDWGYYPALGWDCDDRDAGIHPDNGC